MEGKARVNGTEREDTKREEGKRREEKKKMLGNLSHRNGRIRKMKENERME